MEIESWKARLTHLLSTVDEPSQKLRLSSTVLKAVLDNVDPLFRGDERTPNLIRIIDTMKTAVENLSALAAHVAASAREGEDAGSESESESENDGDDEGGGEEDGAAKEPRSGLGAYGGHQAPGATKKRRRPCRLRRGGRGSTMGAPKTREEKSQDRATRRKKRAAMRDNMRDAEGHSDDASDGGGTGGGSTDEEPPEAVHGESGASVHEGGDEGSDGLAADGPAARTSPARKKRRTDDSRRTVARRCRQRIEAALNGCHLWDGDGVHRCLEFCADDKSFVGFDVAGVQCMYKRAQDKWKQTEAVKVYMVYEMGAYLSEVLRRHRSIKKRDFYVAPYNMDKNFVTTAFRWHRLVCMFPRLRFLVGITYNEVKNNGPFLDALLGDGKTVEDEGGYEYKITDAAYEFLRAERRLLDLADEGNGGGARNLIEHPPEHPRGHTPPEGAASFPLEVDWRDIDGHSAIHLAARGGHTETVQVLVEHAAELVRARTVDGNTALHVAARGGHLAVVAVLMEGGADPCAQNKEGETVERVATMAVREFLHRSRISSLEAVSRSPDYDT